MREDEIESTVVSDAERHGWFQRKVSWIGRKGAPDRVFAKGGRTVWIEFKMRGEKPRADQEDEHAKMRAAGMEVYAVDSIRAGRRVLELPG